MTEYKLEVPAEAVRGVDPDRGFVLMVSWSLLALPHAVEPATTPTGAAADPPPVSAASTSTPTPANAVDAEFMALMARTRRSTPEPATPLAGRPWRYRPRASDRPGNVNFSQRTLDEYSGLSQVKLPEVVTGPRSPTASDSASNSSRGSPIPSTSSPPGRARRDGRPRHVPARPHPHHLAHRGRPSPPRPRLSGIVAPDAVATSQRPSACGELGTLEAPLTGPVQRVAPPTYTGNALRSLAAAWASRPLPP